MFAISSTFCTERKRVESINLLQYKHEIDWKGKLLAINEVIGKNSAASIFGKEIATFLKFDNSAIR